MNTFLNIQQETVLPVYLGATHFCQKLEEKKKAITFAKRYPLQMRITKRGYDEQYKAKYLSNYVGKKRASRNYVVTVDTI